MRNSDVGSVSPFAVFIQPVLLINRQKFANEYCKFIIIVNTKMVVSNILLIYFYEARKDHWILKY